MITTRLRRHEADRTPSELLDAWARKAPSLLGFPEPLWSVPACAAVVEAAVGDPDPLPAVRRFARQRASVGFTLDETVVDLGVLAGLDRATAGAIDRLEVGTAVAEAHSPPESDHCTESLTGLVSRSYLASRLEEVQRQSWALGAPPSSMFHLLVYRLPPPGDVAHAMAGAISAAEALQRAFCGGETVASLNARLFAVLRPTGALQVIEGLPPHTANWVERMPDDEPGLRTLLAELR